MRNIVLSLIIILLYSCGAKSNKNTDSLVKTIEVDPSLFIKDNLVKEITKEVKEINGVKTLCYVITSKSKPTEHQMGPWCPKQIEDTKDKGGLWFKDGEVYDVDGHFITKLDEFYSDDKWKLYREDGSVKYTDTKEACLGAAKPDVEEQYQNHCVECLQEYFAHHETTFVIPVKPIYNSKPLRMKRGALGLALNGVKFDPPAPVHAILAAHTIAPLDDHGGHVNPHGGYHYHAATGSTKEVEQKDHSPLIGYAIDGFGIYGLADENNHIASDLDECGGHIDSVRGYHYHAGEPGGNQIISCLKGYPGYTQTKE